MILLPILLAVVLVLTLIILILRLIRGYVLRRRFHDRWAHEQRFILFVYSESPNWLEYFERNIFPKIRDYAVFLNWSRRSEWKRERPLEAKMLAHWGGDREFNPLAIIVPPKGRVQVIRYFRAFKDYKHGNEKQLREAERKLWLALEAFSSRPV